MYQELKNAKNKTQNKEREIADLTTIIANKDSLLANKDCLLESQGVKKFLANTKFFRK